MDKIDVLIAGDLMPRGNPLILIEDDLKEVLSNKNFSLVNLECPIVENGKPLKKTGQAIRSSKNVVEKIKEVKFDAVCLSNNHIMDYGSKGLEETINRLIDNGIQFLGAGMHTSQISKPLIVSENNIKVCFLNYSESEFNTPAPGTFRGANIYEDIKVYYDITNFCKDYDHVVVIYHGGVEYQSYPTLDMIARFKYMIDLGASSVLAHHAHSYSGHIYYKGKPIHFGLGNFFSISSVNNSEGWRTGLIAKLAIRKNDIALENIPIQRSMDGKMLYLLKGKNKDLIEANISQLSSNINNALFMGSYWDQYLKAQADKFKNLLTSRNKIEYALRKRIPFLKPRISEFNLLNLLNLYRCQSQKELTIKTLEHLYSKLK